MPRRKRKGKAKSKSRSKSRSYAGPIDISADLSYTSFGRLVLSNEPTSPYTVFGKGKRSGRKRTFCDVNGEVDMATPTPGA
jgi:hypothetical protein